MVNAIYNNYNIRLLSIIMIWLLIGVSFVSIFSPIAVVGGEKINSEINDNNEMDTFRTSFRSRGVRSLANSPWPMFRHDLNHTGLSSFNTSSNPGKLKWSFQTGDRVTSSPAIGIDGIIYVGSYDTNLYSIYPNGTEKWRFSTDGIVHSSPAISSDGMIYVGSFDNKIYAIYPDGTEKWNFTTGNTVRSSPTIGVDGTIYIGSYDNKLYAIYPNGTKKWSFTTGSWVKSSTAMDSNGTIYVGSFDNKLYAIYSNGTEKWNFLTGDEVLSSPAIGSDGIIYVGSSDNKLYAFNPNGTEKWNFTTDFTVYSSPALGQNGTIYVGSYDNNLYAINLDGTKKWNFTINDDFHSSPAIGSDGTIFIGSDNHKLYAINPDGSEKWNFTTGSDVFSSPTIGSNGTIYVGSYDGKLYAIGSPGQNQPPIANAGPDQNVTTNQTVNFDGSKSSDPDGDSLKYRWDFGDGTSTNWLSSSKVYHIYTNPGDFTVVLTVSDVLSLTDNDTCTVHVSRASPLANSPWPMFRHDIRHTGLSQYDTSQNTGTLYWSFDTSGAIKSSPAIDPDGMIYFGSTDGNLYALYSNGTKRWSFQTGDGIYSSPAVSSDGTIYVGSLNTKLFAINPDGSEKWNFTTGEAIHSSPTIGLDGTIYIGSTDKKLYAINKDGTEKWKFTTGGIIKYSSPAISYDGTIYIGCLDSSLYAVNPDGTEKWKVTFFLPVDSSPAISMDGTIYIGSYDDKLHAINPDGSEKWSFTTENDVLSSPAISSDGTIYIGSNDNNLYAINPDGTEKWKIAYSYDIESSPTIGSEGTIYVGSEDNNIYAINPNGTEKWKFTTINDVLSSPAIGSDGTIYVSSWDSKLYAIGSNISEENKPPIANAGPDQNVTVNQTINFDGSKSYDPDNDPLKYKWTFGDGTLTGWQDNCNASHSYDQIGIYIVTLTVSELDHHPPLFTNNDTCIVYVLKAQNNTPIIKSSFPSLIELDEDFDIFSKKLTDYESHWNTEIIGDNLKWYVTGNSNTVFYITGDNNTGINADTFEFTSISNQYGTENLTYHLMDPFGLEATIDQTVIVHPINDPPIANAGLDQNITEGQNVTLNGSSSFDIEKDVLTFEWTSSIDGKLGIGEILKNVKLSAGIHTITLRVSDGELTGIDTCIIRVFTLNENLPPVAKITPLMQVYEGKSVLLSAVDSFDEDGYIIEYIWNFGDGSEELHTNKTEVEHTWNSTGNFTITLTVIDNHSAKGFDFLEIIVFQSSTIDSDDDDQKSQDHTLAIILVIIVIIILLLIAISKLFLARSKRQREKIPASDEEILSNMKHKFLQDEPLSEMEYSRNEISEMLEKKFKAGELSKDTYHMIKSEVLFSEEAQLDQMTNLELKGKE